MKNKLLLFFAFKKAAKSKEGIGKSLKGIDKPLKEIDKSLKGIDKPLKEIDKPLKEIDKPLKEIVKNCYCFLFLCSILALVIRSLKPPSFINSLSNVFSCCLSRYVTILIRHLRELAQISGSGFSMAFI